MISFHCTHCKEPLEAPASLSDQSLTCPKCNQSNLVPSSTSPPDDTYRAFIITAGVIAFFAFLLAGLILLIYPFSANFHMYEDRAIFEDNLFVIEGLLCWLLAGITLIATRLYLPEPKQDQSPQTRNPEP
jgi:hypothetical protein